MQRSFLKMMIMQASYFDQLVLNITAQGLLPLLVLSIPVGMFVTAMLSNIAMDKQTLVITFCIWALPIIQVFYLFMSQLLEYFREESFSCTSMESVFHHRGIVEIARKPRETRLQQWKHREFIGVIDTCDHYFHVSTRFRMSLFECRVCFHNLFFLLKWPQIQEVGMPEDHLLYMIIFLLTVRLGDNQRRKTIMRERLLRIAPCTVTKSMTPIIGESIIRGINTCSFI